MGYAFVVIMVFVSGVALGFLIRAAFAQTKALSAESRAQKVILEAEREAEKLTREALGEVKDEISGMRREAEQEVRSRREEMKRSEQRLTQKEEAAEQHRQQLEAVARMTSQEAKEALVTQVVDEAKRQAMATVREIENQAREEGEQRARKIVTIDIQRVASEQTAESTVSVFSHPSEDMKGRIIGREGRNIRAFESVTGVNLIIDDTPEAVVLSCFDPVRRETARMTLEKLVSDGRIHPARIEETFERSKKEIDERLLDPGGVDPAVGHELLQRHACRLPPDGVEAREHHGLGRVVDDEVDPGHRLECPDVPALPADDPALHVLRREGEHRDG